MRDIHNVCTHIAPLFTKSTKLAILLSLPLYVLPQCTRFDSFSGWKVILFGVCVALLLLLNFKPAV